MMKYIIILCLIFHISSIEIYNNQEIPQEIIHEKVQNDTWKLGKFYEYYINISNYELNEENILEIYGVNSEINSNDIEIYLLLTDISDAEFIKNGTIKPDVRDQKNKYIIVSDNIKLDTLSQKNYFFLPFKKSAKSQNFLIILIKNVLYELQTLLYISKRIPIINIEQINPNDIEVYSKEIKVRNDIRLYYKLDIRKINLMKNNVYFFIRDEKRKNNLKGLEVNYYTNLSSLEYYDYNFFIIEKNKFNFSEVIFGIKFNNTDDYNEYNEKYVSLSIRIDDNQFIFLNNTERPNTKLYIEKLSCDKDFYIIENYKTFKETSQKFLILNRLYGNYSFKFYESIKDLDFENFKDEKDNEIVERILFLDDIIYIYKLKCTTPTAFHFEIFTELDTPEIMTAGQSIKTYFPKGYNYSGIDIELDCKNKDYAFNKYKLHIKILDYEPDFNRTLNLTFHNEGKYKKISLLEPDNKHDEIYYDYKYKQNFGFSTTYEILLEYYLTSNHLYTNIVEGRTTIQKNPFPYYALKIRKDFFFDYISFEANCKEGIYGLYELKLINIENIEEESNSLMVGLPSILFPNNFSVKLKFSNPYDKFDQIEDINSLDNYFYLLLQFNILYEPVYINIEYIYNEQIVNLSPIKSEIILPQKEYEIISYNENYEIKDKVLFNINKCNNLVNYTFINYYENKKNIIKETQIKNPHQEILTDNIYYRAKILFNKESEEEINDSTIYPAAYYNKGDILLNYFLIESSILKELKFTSDFTITYEEEDSWNNIKLSWKKYIYRDSNNNIINIPTNYSIYILPKNSIVNTMCQLFLIPSNKSIINKTEIKIDLNEGQYKIAIIASVIDTEIPFEIMYNILELNVIKKTNITTIVLLIFLGTIIIILLILFIFRKKINLCRRKNISNNIKVINLHNSINENSNEDEDEYEKNKRSGLAEKLIKMMNKK